MFDVAVDEDSVLVREAVTVGNRDACCCRVVRSRSGGVNRIRIEAWGPRVGLWLWISLDH